MNDYKLMITGGLDFDDYPLLETSINEILVHKIGNCEIVIVSGASNGAGMLGERYAAEKGYEVAEYRAASDESEEAFCARKSEMAAFADDCIVFWNGRSQRTKNIIHLVTGILHSPTIIYY